MFAVHCIRASWLLRNCFIHVYVCGHVTEPARANNCDTLYLFNITLLKFYVESKLMSV